MNKKLVGATLVALPLAIGSLVLANAQIQVGDKPTQAAAQAFICPATGEELPCPNCCPLNNDAK